MILVGAWLALVGYGILYAGVSKLGGGTCGLRQAFSVTGCPPGGAGTQGASLQGSTTADQRAAALQQQTSTIPDTVLV